MKLDSIWFEVDYKDGRTEYEQRGLSYKEIDRENLLRFRLRDNQGPLLVLETDHIRTGWNLVWRRRVALDTDGSQNTYYLVGWVPMGPVLAVQQDGLELLQHDMFEPGHPLFYPPQQHLHEGERWPQPKAPRIANPSFERTN
jgi:hypothetical protein